MVRQGSTLKAAASALEPPASLNFAVSYRAHDLVPGTTCSHQEPDLEPGTICSEHRARLAVSITALRCSWQRELLSLRGSDPLVWKMRLSRLAVFISAVILGLQRVRW